MGSKKVVQGNIVHILLHNDRTAKSRETGGKDDEKGDKKHQKQGLALSGL